jgi:hypothetical protein
MKHSHVLMTSLILSFTTALYLIFSLHGYIVILLLLVFPSTAVLYQLINSIIDKNDYIFSK